MKALPIFKALSDSTRLRILNILKNQELNVNEIVEILKIGQSGISRHLKILTDANLLNLRKDGLWSFYSFTENCNRQLKKLLFSYFEDDSWMEEDNKTVETVLQQRIEKSVKLFDSLAPQWEKMKKDIFGNTDINDIILSVIPDTHTCADLGCGTGDLILRLLNKCNKVIGVDSSPEMIAETRKRFIDTHGKVDVRMGELEHLPLKEEEADCAICNMVLHHLPEPVTGLLEVQRILKQDGLLIITDFVSHSSEFMRTKYGDRWLGFDHKTLQNWLFDAGFYIKEEKTIPINRDFKVLVISAEKND